MKIVAALDSFKGSATSEALNKAVLSGFPDDVEKVNVPIADGGEGTMASIYASIGGEYIKVNTQDPLGKEITSVFLLTTVEKRNIAVIESAAVVGLHLVDQNEDTTLKASSYGVGEMVLAALDKQVEEIYLTLGGTATSDGGLGFLAAIGATLQPQQKNRRQSINPLLWVESVDVTTIDARLATTKLIGLADVTNPYTGKNGFAHIFGPQKGASAMTIARLDQRATQLALHMTPIEKQHLTRAGSGAAGGLGGAILLANGELKAGFQTIASMIGLKEKLLQADVVITGEGRIDAQTAHGKVPYGVAMVARDLKRPVIVLCGSRQEDVGEMEHLVLGIFSIQQGPITLEKAMDPQVTLTNAKLTARGIAGILGGIINTEKNTNTQ